MNKPLTDKVYTRWLRLHHNDETSRLLCAYQDELEQLRDTLASELQYAKSLAQEGAALERQSKVQLKCIELQSEINELKKSSKDRAQKIKRMLDSEFQRLSRKAEYLQNEELLSSVRQYYPDAFKNLETPDEEEQRHNELLKQAGEKRREDISIAAKTASADIFRYQQRLEPTSGLVVREQDLQTLLEGLLQELEEYELRREGLLQVSDPSPESDSSMAAVATRYYTILSQAQKRS